VVDDSYCTLATIGHDTTGALVGFTAAHCGGPGAGYVIPGFPGMADIPETRALKFSAILADANAKGGPGARFTPIPT
jgi:hypothetical protein